MALRRSKCQTLLMLNRMSHSAPKLLPHARTGGFWLIAAFWISAASADAEGWPMFRGGQALLGVAEGNLPLKLNLLWTCKTGGPVKSSAAINQDKAFIGSNDGNIYALSLADGKKLWSFKTGGAVESSPLTLEGKVFAGSSDSSLYALEAATGKLL